MKYLPIILLVSAVSFVFAEAKIPDYIHTCKRNDPEISKCIENSILSLREKLTEGIPELGVSKIDPMHMGKLVFNLGAGISAEGTDLQLTGGKNFQIKNFVANIDTETYSFDLIIPKANARGNYAIDATIGALPLKGKGPINISAKSVFGRATLHAKRVVRGSKTRYYYPSMDLKLQISDYEIKLERLFEGAPEIGEVMNKLLNDEKEEVLASVLPAIEKAITKEILDSANRMVKPYTWDELFPQ